MYTTHMVTHDPYCVNRTHDSEHAVAYLDTRSRRRQVWGMRLFYVLTSCWFMGSARSGSHFKGATSPRNTSNPLGNSTRRMWVCELLVCRFRKGGWYGWKPSSSSTSKFELFEFIVCLKLDKQFPVERFEVTVSQSTVPSHPLKNCYPKYCPSP